MSLDEAGNFPILGDMSDASITAAEIRAALVERAELFARITGSSLSAIGEQAVRDSKCVVNIKNGSNFTIKTYQRIVDWLDASWPEEDAASATSCPAKSAATISQGIAQ